jgi:chromosome segregation ATPase
MSPTYNQLRAAKPDQQWKLKSEDGSVFGPVPTAELVTWARQGRVAPAHKLSADGRDWFPAFDLAELGMLWMLEMGGGESCGPFNIMALGELVQEGTIVPSARVTQRLTGQASTVEAQLATQKTAAPVAAPPAEDVDKLKREWELQQRETADRVTQMTRRIQTLETELAAQQATVQEARRHLESQSREGDRTRAQDSGEVVSLRQALASLEQQRSSLAERLEKAEAEVRQAQAAVQQPRPEDQAARQRAEQVQRQLEEAQAALKQAQAQQEAEAGDQARILQVSAQRETDWNGELQKLRDQVGQHAAALAEARRNLAEEQARRVAVQTEVDAQVRRVESLAAEAKSAQAELERTRQELAQQVETRRQVEQEARQRAAEEAQRIAQLSRQTDVAADQIKTAQGEAAQRQAEAEAARQQAQEREQQWAEKVRALEDKVTRSVGALEDQRLAAQEEKQRAAAQVRALEEQVSARQLALHAAETALQVEQQSRLALAGEGQATQEQLGQRIRGLEAQVQCPHRTASRGGAPRRRGTSPGRSRRPDSARTRTRIAEPGAAVTA